MRLPHAFGARPGTVRRFPAGEPTHPDGVHPTGPPLRRVLDDAYGRPVGGCCADAPRAPSVVDAHHAVVLEMWIRRDRRPAGLLTADGGQLAGAVPLRWAVRAARLAPPRPTGDRGRARRHRQHAGAAARGHGALVYPAPRGGVGDQQRCSGERVASQGMLPGSDGRLRVATEPQLDAAVDAVVGLHADGALRLLVVRAGGPGRHIGASFGSRSGLCARSRRRGATVGGATDPAALVAVLTQLDGEHGAHRALVAGTIPGQVRASARRWGVALHIVAEPRRWARVAYSCASSQPRRRAARPASRWWPTTGARTARARRRPGWPDGCRRSGRDERVCCCRRSCRSRR